MEELQKAEISQELFDTIKAKCPEFLTSYFVLVQFYDHLTNNFTHKLWKDGRILLTPKKNENGKVAIDESVS